jgi:hypothetical protein
MLWQGDRANLCAAEAKGEKFMRFSMGEDAPDDGFEGGGDGDIGMAEDVDDEGISQR